MAHKKISSWKKVKPEHKIKIYHEAIRLNGSATSMRGFTQLQRFAKRECDGIILSKLTLRRVIKHTHGEARTSTWHSRLGSGIRPSFAACSST